MSNRKGQRKHSLPWAVAIAGVALLSGMARASDACLLTPAQLQTLTGRAFAEGEPGKNLGDGSPLCHFAEQANPKRKLTIGVSSTNARQQFDSRVRMLQIGGKPITLDGVGDRAYYNGTSAGVLDGDRLITLSNLRRASDPKIEPAKVVAALQAMLKK